MRADSCSPKPGWHFIVCNCVSWIALAVWNQFARANEVQNIKRRVPFSKAIMQVNPKTDAHQRRLQCSIRFGDFFHFLASNVDPMKQAKPQLWGVQLPK